MTTALWRKLRADIRSSRLLFLLIGGVLTLSAMLLTLSILVLGSAADPWERTFDATNGPHVWVVSHDAELDFSPLLENPAVQQSSGVILALAENPLVLGDEKIPAYLYAMDERPPVAHPLIAAGRWLESGQPDEVVLDFSLAKYYGFEVGDTVTFLGVDGPRGLTIVGLAVTAHWFPYDEITKDSAPGVAYIRQSTLETLQPDSQRWYSVIGLRLHDPEDSRALVNGVDELFPGKILSAIEWHFLQDTASLSNTLNAMFMGLFSVLGLAAVGMIIFNTIGGQVLGQFREIGLLKAVGFSPRQITLLLLSEHLAIGLVAALLGILLGLAAAPGLVGAMAANLNTAPPNIYAPAPLVGVLILIELAVALATLLPAWQGGRIDAVQAITIGYRSPQARPSRLARWATWLRLPLVVVLGVKDTFTRPLRAVLAIASLALTVLVAFTAVGGQATTAQLARNRFYFNGSSADMKVARNFIPPGLMETEILSRPEVVDHYEELFLYGQAPGAGDQPIAIRLLQGNYTGFDFQIKEGRMIAAPGEAVMGYAVLELLGWRIGDVVEITIEGSPVQLTIVGRHMENFNLNHVILASLETYRQQVDPAAMPSTYYLRLADRQLAQNLRREWLDQSQGMLQASVFGDQPVASVVQLTNLITSLAAILMLVAAVNLMSASLLSIRERVRDFGIQKTLGFTPAQIAASVVVGAVTIALFALLIGVSLGLVFMNQFVQRVGVLIGAGPDFYTIDWGGVSLLLPILLLVAIASSLLPARRAARLEVTRALRYE